MSRLLTCTSVLAEQGGSSMNASIQPLFFPCQDVMGAIAVAAGGNFAPHGVKRIQAHHTDGAGMCRTFVDLNI